MRTIRPRNCAARLRTGDVLFEKVRVLHAGELDRKAVFDMAHHPARPLAKGDEGAGLGPVLARARGARGAGSGRSATQVSGAASLPRLRGVAAIDIAKPCGSTRTIVPSSRP